ncbi:MAG: AAA family ATPase [Fusobacteriaceae bacterium]|jgi:SpoVK/Ycf46/Vps4 family AAA+-type ATPase|nr:AAA family ATPase [Fusobacteriaceae bacterium]
MATIEQLKALVRTHFEADEEKFKSIALQIAAHEARAGHIVSAREIRDIVQSPKNNIKKKKFELLNKNDILDLSSSDVQMKDLILSESLNVKINRILTEYKNRDLLGKNGLKNRSKILITGEPGTGKTMTAAVLANELGLDLFVIQIDKLITKYMGETSIKMRQVFEQIEDYPSVYLFDEFDAIGSDRTLDNDVGEMRRILNSFLQFLENANSYSIIIAATNSPNILDKALFRRFDDVLKYEIPDINQIEMILLNKLKDISPQSIFNINIYKKIVELYLSHADIIRACNEAIKLFIIDRQAITEEILISFLKDRVNLFNKKEA